MGLKIEWRSFTYISHTITENVSSILVFITIFLQIYVTVLVSGMWYHIDEKKKLTKILQIN